MPQLTPQYLAMTQTLQISKNIPHLTFWSQRGLWSVDETNVTDVADAQGERDDEATK